MHPEKSTIHSDDKRDEKSLLKNIIQMTILLGVYLLHFFLADSSVDSGSLNKYKRIPLM